MSSHPQIERLIDSVKTSINKYLGIFDTSEAGSFRKGFAKSAIWTLGALIAITLPIAIVQQLQPGSHWLENAARIALAIVASALGQNVNLLGVMGAGSTTISVGAHPALLTILVALFAFRSGKALSSDVAKRLDSGKNHRFALGLGLGSSVALLASTWILQGAFGWGASIASLTLSTAFDFFFTFALVAFPAWMGTKSGEVATVKKTVWAWARRATLNFVVLYSALLAVAFVVWVIFNLVAPHFTQSQPENQSSGSLDLGQLTLALIVILSYLPNALFMLFAAGMGMSAGLDAHATQGLDALLGSIQAYLPVEVPTSFSINSVYGMILETLVLMVVAVVALIAGAAANRKSGYTPKSGIDFIQSLFTVVVIGIFATYLGNISGSWSVPPTAQVAAVTGSVSFGVLLASLAIVISLVVIFAWLAGAKAELGLANAFPRWTSRLTGSRIGERNQTGWVIFGRLTTAALVLGLVAYPLTSATVSRVWASTDNPLLIGQTLSKQVLDGKMEALKKLVGPTVKDEDWLPDAALAAALPNTTDELKLAVTNNQNKAWAVGNTDALVTVTWKRNKTVAKWLVPTSSKVKNHYLLVDHPEFRSQLSVIYLDVKVNSFVSQKTAAELKVNGASVTPGTYAVVPGFYRITLPGQDMISPTEILVATDGNKTNYIAGNEAEIPAGGDEKLNASIDSKEKKCNKIAANGSASCFTTKSVTGNVVDQDKAAPNTYFDSVAAGYKLTSITCDADSTDELLTSKVVKRSQPCTAKATFTRTYFKGNSYQKSVPIWDDWGCWDDWYGEYYSCVVGYEKRTVKVRGAKISTVTFNSEFALTLSAVGTLKNGKFLVK